MLEAALAAQAALNAGTPLSRAKGVDLAAAQGARPADARSRSSTSSTSTRRCSRDAARKAELAALVAPAHAVFLDAKIESELIDLDPADAAELLASTGQTESRPRPARPHRLRHPRPADLPDGRARRSRAPGRSTRATRPRRRPASSTPTSSAASSRPRSSRFDDLVATGSIAEARAKGKARIEGKDYVMHDGDVVEFRFNV